MMLRTHLAIGAGIILFFLTSITYKIAFIPVVLIASIAPDIDTGFSYLGRKKIFSVFQFIFKHRGFVHSFTICVLLSILFAFFWPVIALPFFLGYGGHLFADSLTLEGINPLWPFKFKSSGKIRTGGRVEDGVFLAFLVIDLALALFLFI